ncbi:hypothetical protein H0H81_001035, partial [Sphagnurus paluster]
YVPSELEITEIPHMHKPGQSKVEHVRKALDILRPARITPAENASDRLETLLDTIWSNEKGARAMKAWFYDQAIDLVCDLVNLEMEAAKPALHMSTSDITTDFIASWDINSFMDPIAEKITPVWSRVLRAATESKQSKEKAKTPRSRNCHVVSLS